MTRMKRIYEDGGDQDKNEDDGKECKELNKAEQWRKEDEIICASCCKWKTELQVDHEEKARQSPFLTLLCNYVISPIVIVSRELTV